LDQVAAIAPSSWTLSDLVIFTGLALVLLDRLLDVTGRLPSSKRLRIENEHLTQVNSSYLVEIDQLKKRVGHLQSEVDRLKLTDMSAMLAMLKSHDNDMKTLVPEIVSALQDVRTSLHDLALEIRSGRPISA
jgi:hypothetical protein